MSKTKLLLFAVCGFALLFLLTIFGTAVKYDDEASKPESLTIYPGATASEVIDSLSAKGCVRSSITLPLSIYMASHLNGLKPGSYELTDGISVINLVNNVVKGYQTPVRLTFNNIRTREQLCSRIASQLMTDSADIAEAMRNDSLLRAYGMDTLSILNIFLPDTYEVYWTAKPVKLMDKLHDAYDDYWTAERDAKAKAAGLSRNEVMVLASIVEEESNMRSEQPTIAGLYLNRLRKGMKLQADPTVKFAVGDFGLKRILLEHINKTRSNPYNTYTNHGLPPGEIRIPSKSTVEAVLNYEKHDYLFMCAKGAGGHGHDFTRTYGEHQRNAAKYQKKLDKLGIK